MLGKKQLDFLYFFAAAYLTAILSLMADTLPVITDLGTLGGNASYAYSINDMGQVVGYAYNASNEIRAFLWQQHAMVDLGTLPGGTSSVAWDINNDGVIVGYSSTTNGADMVSPLPLHAFVYSNGVMRDLGTLGGENSYAFSLNAHGDVVGCSQEPSDVDPQAVIYTADGGLIDLDTLSGGWLSSQAYGINDATQVVGQSHMFYPGVPGDRWHPFLWHDINGNKTNDGGEMINLGTLGGHYGIALDINEQGTVVGSADITNSPVRIEHAFLVHPENGKWLQDTNYDQRNDFMTDIGSLGGSTISAYSINEQEVVVGAATDSNEVQHAFMWQSGSMTSLNDMAGTSQGWELRNARSVNKYQEIVGYGFLEGMARAYLLSFPFRIFGIEPMGTYTTNLYLSISNQVETQILFQVSGHTLDWSTCRIEDDSNFVYTVECYYPTGQSGWVTVSPTDDWPSSTTSWTNSGVTNKQMELFRIRADPGP